MSLAEKERVRARCMEADLRIIVRIAKRLSRKTDWLSVEDVKLHFENAGMLLAYSDRGYASRVWSRVMHRSGLTPIKGVYRRSTRKGRRGGNLCQVWRRAA